MAHARAAAQRLPRGMKGNSVLAFLKTSKQDHHLLRNSERNQSFSTALDKSLYLYIQGIFFL